MLRPDLGIHAIYSGRYFVGRPTSEELRHDLRTIMETRSDYHYEAYDAPEVRRIRIPQQEWADGLPPPGANGLPVAQGVVRWFDFNAGIGMIARAGSDDEVFFHFTALPGQEYRTIRPGTLCSLRWLRRELAQLPAIYSRSSENLPPVSKFPASSSQRAEAAAASSQERLGPGLTGATCRSFVAPVQDRLRSQGNRR